MSDGQVSGEIEKAVHQADQEPGLGLKGEEGKLFKSLRRGPYKDIEPVIVFTLINELGMLFANPSRVRSLTIVEILLQLHPSFIPYRS